MSRSRSWRAVTAVGLTTTLLGSAYAADAATRVGAGDVKVVRDAQAAADPFPAEHDPVAGDSPADILAEPSVAVDPTDAKRAFVAFKVGIGQAIGYVATSDGGRTWSPTVAVPKTLRAPLTDPTSYLASYAGTSDPVVAFGPDGVAYVMFIAFTQPDEGNGQDLKIMATSDLGRTWRGPFTISRTPLGGLENGPDKPWLTVDLGTGVGHHPGRLYAVWSQEPAVPAASFSDDGGQTWSPPTPILATTPPVHGSDFQTMVLDNGSLGVFYDTGDYRAVDPSIDQVPEDYRFTTGAVSPLGVLSFTPPVTVAPALHSNEPDLAGVFDVSAATVDPTTGRIFAAWPDNSSGRGYNDIVLTTSDDDGVTWTTPRRLNDDAAGDHFHPAIAVDAYGRLRVAWRQRPEDAPGVLGQWVNTVVTTSSDGGTRFGKDVQINRVSTSLDFAEPSSDTQKFLGDYDEMAGAGPFTYLARAEAGPVTPGESPTPHQRIWVAVLGD